MKSIFGIRLPVAALLVAAAVLLTACSDGEHSDLDETTDAASDAPPITEAEPTATPQPTPSPVPTQTPEPTATPTPEPLFTRVVMPDRAVGEPLRFIVDTTAPARESDWIGAGYELAQTDGLSRPLAWTLQLNSGPLFDRLPYEESGDGGAAQHAAIIQDRHVLGGSIRQDGIDRAALWSRDQADTEWQLLSDIVDLPTRQAGTSQVWDLAGSREWGLLLFGFTSAHAVDEFDAPQRNRWLLHTTNGQDWQPLELPGITTDEWQIATFVHANNGFIVAKSSNPDKPESKFFFSDDAGTRWTSTPVSLRGQRPVTVRDATWINETWAIVGDEGEGDERVPVTFTLQADGSYEPNEPQLEPSSEFQSADMRFEAIELAGETQIGVIKVGDDYLAVTSTDGQRWALHRDVTFRGEVFDLEPDPRGDRLFTALGARPPSWVSPSGQQGMYSPEQRLDFHELRGLSDSGGQISALFSISGETGQTHVWKSADGITWNRLSVDRTLVDAKVLEPIDESLFVYGTNRDDFAFLRILGPTGTKTEIDIADLLGPLAGAGLTSPVTAVATGRNLVATAVADEDDEITPVFTFVDVDDPQKFSVYQLPSAEGSRPLVVCPQLASGAIVVSLYNGPSTSMDLEIWADAPEPQLGSVSILDRPDMTGTIGFDCARYGDGLMLAGEQCDTQSCFGALWYSADGFIWHHHNSVGELLANDIEFVDQVASSRAGAFVLAESGSSKSLWLITAERALLVPLEPGLTEGASQIDHLAVVGESVVVGNRLALFQADLDELVERTLLEAGLDPKAAFEPWPDMAALAASRDTESTVEPELAPILISGPFDSSSSGSSPQAVPGPPTPAATTPAPTPLPTAPPTTTSAVPQCAPGDLTTTGQCRCSGGRLYDDGGQCKVRCSGSEQPDGFGGCIKADGTEVDPGTSSGGGSVTLGTSCVAVDDATGELRPCADN